VSFEPFFEVRKFELCKRMPGQ